MLKRTRRRAQLQTTQTLPAHDGASQALQVELEEFRALRTELLTRIEKQQEITGFAIALFAAVLAVGQFIQPDQTFVETARDLLWLLPLASIILSAFTLMTLEYEVNIAHILVYIDTELRPRVLRELGDDGGVSGRLAWNLRRASWQQHAGWRSVLTSVMASAKYAATIIPNAAIMWFYVQEVPARRVFARDGVPFWIAALALLLVLLSAAYTSSVYLTMTYREARGRRS